jgi:Kef-type K+ transport system membrane component KefB
VGLGLWRSIPATLAVEGLLFVAGLGTYLATTRALNRKGTIGLWAFVAFLVLAYAGNVGQPPPSITAVTAVGLGVVALLIPWIWWFDRNRELRGERAARLPVPPSQGRA